MSTPPDPARPTVAAFFGQLSGTFGQDDDAIRRFPHYGRRLVEIADLHVGSRVLDIATGRGAVLFPAAERVGPGGSVIGIDLAPAMVEETARDIQQRGLTNAEARVMDGENLEFDTDSFDAILCGFGLMFFPHLAAALAGFRRVLRPGGVLAVSTWERPGPDWAWEMELWQEFGIADRHPWRLMAQPLATPDELASTLRDAGFANVRVTSEVDERQHPDAASWWAKSMVLPGTKVALSSLGPARADEFQRAALVHVERMAGPKGIVQRIVANVGTARNS